MHIDFNSYAKFICVYIPENPDAFSLAKTILTDIENFIQIDKGYEVRMPSARLTPGIIQIDRSDSIKINCTFWDESPVDSNNISFSRRVFYYLEGEVAGNQVEELKEIANSKHLDLQIRSEAHKQKREKLEKPLAFICHDSRDKDSIARPLATRLIELACPVWFDEFSLSVGDSLRESVEAGIKECSKCIIIVTPNFIGNEGWPKKEFNGVFTKEIIEKEDIFLPIWNDVSTQDVFDYSPILADRFAARWEDGLDSVIRKIYTKIVSNN